MKKYLLVLLIALSCLSPANAQTQKDIDRKELRDLLDDRKKKFDAYSLSLEKHSGIFGNKTKNDVKRSNEVLIDIVKTDNRIISTLYRVVDFRNYEKVNMNYDVQRKDETLNNLRHATDTLSKQVDALKSMNKELHAKSLWRLWLIYALLIIIAWMIVSRWRKQRSKQDTPVTV